MGTNLLRQQHLIGDFCCGKYISNIAKSNLSHKKHFEILHVLLQRDQGGRSMQCFDHDQNSRVGHISQSWSYKASVLPYGSILE